MKNIIVSVIVPNYNHSTYLNQRIDSILNQTYQDFELIFLDDCSTDNSREILESYRDNPHVSHIIFNEKNSGSPFAQWMKGISLAKGKYIWIAESDDYAAPEFLEYTVFQLEQHTDARICLTGSHIVDSYNNSIPTDEFDKWTEDDKSYLFSSEEYLVTHMFRNNSVYNASGVLFRKEGAIDGIDKHFCDMRYCGDWLFWIEQIKKGNVIEVHKKLNYFRKHDFNTTKKGAKNGNSMPEIIYIRKIFYTQILGEKKTVMLTIDKSQFYRFIKHLKVTKERKRELLRLLKEDLGIGFFTYLKGKWLRSFIKRFRNVKYKEELGIN